MVGLIAQTFAVPFSSRKSDDNGGEHGYNGETKGWLAWLHRHVLCHSAKQSFLTSEKSGYLHNALMKWRCHTS
eukprot:scaffold166305_cov15-Tisochrysis_lutea.AAC.1